MNRRDFFKRLGGAALAAPLVILGLFSWEERSGVAWRSYYAGAILNRQFGRGLRAEHGKLESYRTYDNSESWKQWHARTAMDGRFGLW